MIHAKISRSVVVCLLRWLVNHLVTCRMQFRDTRPQGSSVSMLTQSEVSCANNEFSRLLASRYLADSISIPLLPKLLALYFRWSLCITVTVSCGTPVMYLPEQLADSQA